MRILLASSEVHPYSKTGGLADMVGALGKALAKSGHRVGMVTPLYQGIRESCPHLRRLNIHLDFPLGHARVQGEVWALEKQPHLTIYFVDQPDFFQRAGLYQSRGVDYPDNAERFVFFSKAVAHLGLHLQWKPEVVHLNDWQTGFAALFLAHQRKVPGWAGTPRTCMTIHNLAYQGVFPASHYALTNLPWDYYVPSGVEFYGKVSCLKAGIAFADFITTVSPRYAREIMTEEYGCGLEGLLRHRQDLVKGILNGVDYDEWNTVSNSFIKHPYSSDDPAGKNACKRELQVELGLPPRPDVPLFGSIGRLAEQKGVDIMLPAMEEMLVAELQFVMLGTGAPQYERAFKDLAEKHPGKASVTIGFDNGLSHRIESGCDFFLMPSRFEPCGLNQMYSLRYGTVPVVRATGGLDNTVTDARDNLAEANGIKFTEYLPRALSKAIRKALVLYSQPQLYSRFRENGIRSDFSWNRTAGDYSSLYEQLTK